MTTLDDPDDAAKAGSTACLNPFRPEGLITLKDVMEGVAAGLDGDALRDLRSAFRFMEERLGVDLASTPATAPVLRKLFDGAVPAKLDITAKRLANVRLLVSKAVEQAGMRRRQLTRRTPLSDAWADLLGQVTRLHHRLGLSRLARYGSAIGIRPDEVNREVLLGLLAALDAECIVKDPRKLLGHTIAIWNMCKRTVRGWPPIILSSPFRQEPHTLPLEAFPASFQHEVGEWVASRTSPDLLTGAL